MLPGRVRLVRKWRHVYYVEMIRDKYILLIFFGYTIDMYASLQSREVFYNLRPNSAPNH